MNLGWWTMSGECFLSALKRVAEGEDPEMIYAEYYANSDIETVKPKEDEDGNG